MTPPSKQKYFLENNKFYDDPSKRMRVADNSGSYYAQLHQGTTVPLHQWHQYQTLAHSISPVYPQMRQVQSAPFPMFAPTSTAGVFPCHQSEYQTYVQTIQTSRHIPANTVQPSNDMYFFHSVLSSITRSNNSEHISRKIINFFRIYADNGNTDIIGPLGIERLCRDLQVKPDDVVMLVLAWKLNAKVMGVFTIEEWKKGMTELKCDSISKLRNKIDYLRSCLDDPTHFRNIYRYSFDFVKENNVRSIDIEVAKQMMTMLLKPRWPLLELFLEYLNYTKYRVVNKDQYYNVLDFSIAVSMDLRTYDENGAWPVMLDEFVEWCRAYKGFFTPAKEEPKKSIYDFD